MDAFNLTQIGSAASSVAKTNTPTVNGNALPDVGQVHVGSEYRQDDIGSASQSTAAFPASQSPASQPNAEELQDLVKQANVALQGHSSDLKFTIAEGTDISVVRVEDTETGEVIRQFPSEEMVAIARALGEAQQGMMFEEKA